jgi:hypothetical protein
VEVSTARHPLPSFFFLFLLFGSDDRSSGASPIQADEEVASRCETVLNTTMAEMDIYHTQKVEDFASLAKEHLDGEIEFYEQVKFPSQHLGVEPPPSII